MTRIPFSSTSKRMTVAYKLPDQEIVRIIVKGAPEYIVPLCTLELDSSNYPTEFNGIEEQGSDHLEAVISNQIAKLGEKPLTIAYKDINLNEFLEFREFNQNFETESGRAHLEINLCYIASFGIRDDLRDGCEEIMKKLYEGLTNTRILQH